MTGNYLHTRDPKQATAWLVEGAPARPCSEYLPHAAAYVELVAHLQYPVGSVRFETPDSEADMSLDLAVVDVSGRVLVLGEVKSEARQVAKLPAGLLAHAADPGMPAPVRAGGPHGSAREAWKLAHQLWRTRAPWLWLVASGYRAAYSVTYNGTGMTLRRVELPAPEDLPSEPAHDWPNLSA